MEVLSNKKCRYYDLVMTKDETNRHFAILDKLSKKYGEVTIGGGRSGPLVNEHMKTVPGKYRLIFQLVEKACTAYEVEMGISK